MLLIAALFTALSVGSLIMFKKVTQHKDGILTVTKDIISKRFCCDNRDAVKVRCGTLRNQWENFGMPKMAGVPSKSTAEAGNMKASWAVADRSTCNCSKELG